MSAPARVADFHMHTTHSDGTYSPEELMRACKEKNISCAAVTDHDTMSSFKLCESEAQKLGLELIPGIEISATFDPGTMHILGYFLDIDNPELKAALEEIQQVRRERNSRMIEKLNEAGIEITLEEVVKEALRDDNNPFRRGHLLQGVGADVKQIGRPHFAKVLVKKRVVKDAQEAFQKYLGKGCSAYLDKQKLTPEEAVGLINRAGGIASIAHPKQMKVDDVCMEKEIKKLTELGLGGLEVYNSCQDIEENAVYLKMAKRYNLVPTGGSDFHGPQKPGVQLGFAGAGIQMGYEMVDALREKIVRRSGNQ